MKLETRPSRPHYYTVVENYDVEKQQFFKNDFSHNGREQTQHLANVHIHTRWTFLPRWIRFGYQEIGNTKGETEGEEGGESDSIDEKSRGLETEIRGDEKER